MSERKVIVKGPPPEGYVELLIAEYGSLKAFAEKQAARSELVKRFFGQGEALRKLYPDKFAAMGPGDVLIIADTLEELLQRIDEQGIPRKEVVTDFLDVEWGPMVV